MSQAIIKKDLTLLSRETLVRLTFYITIALVIGSLVTGFQREQVFEKEKSAALATDKAVWMDQGDRNPHSAAHFSRYAFRPASPLAMLDPGTTDFAGLAVWMEAHYQDPAVFRRAEDAGELSRFARLTPAFLVLTVGPLLVFLMLFSSVAGEREDGTLRQLLATGVSSRQFFNGKFRAGLRLTLLAFTAVYVPAALAAVALTPADAGGDAIVRAAALYVVYAAYLVACVCIAIGVSAWFRTRQAAFLALTAVWALMAILVPRFAADLGTTLYPQPDAWEASTRLRAASDIYYADMDRRTRIEEEVLDRYNVTSIEALPINYGAYVLQYSEELSEPEFDRFYNDLDDRYAEQEGVLRWLSLLTPTVAAANLSRGIAGTDRAHQRSFAQAAEARRRDMIQLLNEDYMYNADNSGAVYTADAELWAKFEDLDYRMPELRHIAAAYGADLALLLLWLIAAFLVASRAVGRAVRGEVAAA
ncbi:MAG: DUF3526 domain-containing protein [Pseudomonadota bacterium]